MIEEDGVVWRYEYEERVRSAQRREREGGERERWRGILWKLRWT